MNKEFNTGSYVSPLDYRDRVAASATFGEASKNIILLPEKFRTDMGKVFHQRATPSCVAHDVVMLMRRYWFKKTGKWINLSPRFLDILVKRIDGQPRLTGGTYPRMVLKLAATVGCCTEDLLLNDTTLPMDQYRDDSVITAEMMKEAEKWKIPGYINVPINPTDTRNAIYLYEALTSLFIIGEEFWTPSWSPSDINPVRTPAKPVSGHQLAPCGWDSPRFNIGCNEWGEDWNLKGYFHYDPIVWGGFIVEQWAIAEVPNDIKAFLSLLPSPQEFHYNWTKNFKRGDIDPEIGMVQVAYMILGHLKPIAPEDFGHFGPKTAAANYAFQTSNGISPSINDIGPKTRAALNKKFLIS